MPSKVVGGNGLRPTTRQKKSELLFPVDPWFWKSQRYKNLTKGLRLFDLLTLENGINPFDSPV
jgi:hypothetical protein